MYVEEQINECINNILGKSKLKVHSIGYAENNIIIYFNNSIMLADPIGFIMKIEREFRNHGMIIGNIELE